MKSFNLVFLGSLLKFLTNLNNIISKETSNNLNVTGATTNEKKIIIPSMIEVKYNTSWSIIK